MLKNKELCNLLDLYKKEIIPLITLLKHYVTICTFTTQWKTPH
jgi:hypothetical protein